jgi:UDP-GlcNAc3NAcA epimerase
MDNLRKEGLADRAHRVGDVMLDAYRHSVAALDEAAALRAFALAPNAYVLATVHRAENTDRPEPLREIVATLAEIARERPVVLPLHPRTRGALARLDFPTGAIRIVEPQPYSRMLALLRNAAALATDSGGMQKEAYFSAVPCVTLRDETEWVETVASGWNRLAPPAAGRAALAAAIREAAATRPAAPPPPVYGDGDAAGRILAILAARA